MKREKIIQLFQYLGTKHAPHKDRGVWVAASCALAPWTHGGFDKDPSFAIKASDKKKSICKCLSCGFGGDLMDLAYEIKKYQKKQAEAGYNLGSAMQLIANEFADLDFDMASIPDWEESRIEKKELVFPETWLQSFHRLNKFPEAHSYVLSRGVPEQMILDLDLRYDPIQHRVGFPFRNFKGQLMGMQGRSIEKIPHNDLRYFQYGYQQHRNMHCWMGEDSLDLDKPVVVCEGPFDLTSIKRVYPNVAASFTSGLSVEKIKRLADATEIITVYDYGKGGNAARKKIHEVLKGYPITDIIPTEEQDDAGNLSLEEVAEYLEEHVTLRYYSGSGAAPQS